MQRQQAIYAIIDTDVPSIKYKMLNWVRRFSIFAYLDSNSYPCQYGRYECLVAAGAVAVVDDKGIDPLSSLLELHQTQNDWIFGHISYDYKNNLEKKLFSKRHYKTGFPTFHFFVPQTVCTINKESTALTISSCTDPDAVYQQIMECDKREHCLPKVNFTSMMSREHYLSTVSTLRVHIAKGDCYEINLCNEAFVKNVVIDPVSVFEALNSLSPAPFAACYRLYDSVAMCASPERYLSKEDNTIISQPIKGTIARGENALADEQQQQALYHSIKERAENVMIVDLVRNDLARSCNVGSVKVNELFGIHTFPQVYQMMSTITGTLSDNARFTDAIRYSFPMGSMTGAPKHKVMQMIEQYELSARELFSGTIGYMTPEGDFDFNVVIRSLFYNTATKYLSYQTGGAITYDSDPEQEWEEMRLKAWALERIFQ